MRDHCDEGRDSKVGEDAASECSISNAFNAIVKTKDSMERMTKSMITNPPE
jgi:hypothetical protein